MTRYVRRCFNTLNGSIYVGTQNSLVPPMTLSGVSIPSTGRFTLEQVARARATFIYGSFNTLNGSIYVGTRRRENASDSLIAVSIPSTGRFTLEQLKSTKRMLSATGFNTLNGSIYVGTRESDAEALEIAEFQYPQRVDLRWNTHAFAAGDTVRVFQYPQRVDLRWNISRVRLPIVIS